MSVRDDCRREGPSRSKADLVERDEGLAPMPAHAPFLRELRLLGASLDAVEIRIKDVQARQESAACKDADRARAEEAEALAALDHLTQCYRAVADRYLWTSPDQAIVKGPSGRL